MCCVGGIPSTHHQDKIKSILLRVFNQFRNSILSFLSFVENNHGESDKAIPFDEWCASEMGRKSFVYDTDGATKSDLVIYVGPSGCDAWAEVGAAWSRGVPIIGLHAKGEQVGLMRLMVLWVANVKEMWEAIDKSWPPITKATFSK